MGHENRKSNLLKELQKSALEKDDMQTQNHSNNLNKSIIDRKAMSMLWCTLSFPSQYLQHVIYT